MTADKFARFLAGLAVLAVAIVAGIVSFSHIETLALANGYSADTARLAPASVDGLIIAASLALLTGARAHREAPRLARAGLVLGIVATLAANVEAGARFGVVGALVNAWPAVAFIVASETLLGMLHATPDVASADQRMVTVPLEAPTALLSTPETVSDVVPEAVPVAGPEDVPEDVPEIVTADVPASTVYPRPVSVPRTVPPTRAPRRAPSGKAKSPEKLFAAEIERGELPSLREVKRRAMCGTDCARAIRDQLAQMLEALPEAA